MKNPVNFGFFFDKRNQKKDGTYAVKLQVIYQRKATRYRTGVSLLTREDFENALSVRPKKEFKTIQRQLFLLREEAERIAENIIKENGNFSLKQFKQELFYKEQEEENQKEDVFSLLRAYHQELIDNGQMNSSYSYQSTIKTLGRFYSKRVLPFETVTVDFLKRLESYMLKEGKSPTTVGFYTKCLRKVLYVAIEKKYMKYEDLPFGKGRYQIPQPQNIKKALSIEDLKKILAYIPSEALSSEQYYYDLWIFSYLGNGINIKDISRLTYKDIQGDYIHFLRAKTAQVKRTNKPISFFLNDRQKEIIDRWGTDPNKGGYIFPILTAGLTPRQEMIKISTLVKQINKYMRRIGRNLGIKQDITTYAARHSFATVLKNSGQPISMISEALGHSNVQVTEHYLGSFDNESKKRMSDLLTDL